MLTGSSLIEAVIKAKDQPVTDDYTIWAKRRSTGNDYLQIPLQGSVGWNRTTLAGIMEDATFYMVNYFRVYQDNECIHTSLFSFIVRYNMRVVLTMEF